jgi:hypothetical protein
LENVGVAIFFQFNGLEIVSLVVFDIIQNVFSILRVAHDSITSIPQIGKPIMSELSNEFFICQ